MKVKVDQDLCAACGLCADVCPEVFELKADGKAVPKAETVPAAAEESCRDAAAQCPAEAILIEE